MSHIPRPWLDRHSEIMDSFVAFLERLAMDARKIRNHSQHIKSATILRPDQDRPILPTTPRTEQQRRSEPP